MAIRLLVRHPRSAAGEAGESRFEFDQARVVIGRGAGVDVRLPGRGVSEAHATIEARDGRYTLRDEGSTNGTLVNGAALVPLRARGLSDGDVIQIGEFTLAFHDGPLRHGVTKPERTASLARRMLCELLDDDGAASMPPYLRVTEGDHAGTVVNLGELGARFVIGRGAEADLVLDQLDVSRAHVELVRDLDGTVARDLGSKNGLDVNGRRMRERRLRHGDVLRIGGSALLYQDPAEQALRDLERQPVEVAQAATRTRTAPPAAPDEPAPPPVEEGPPEEAPEPPPELEPPRSPVDVAVYALAVFVLTASLFGLVWLLG